MTIKTWRERLKEIEMNYALGREDMANAMGDEINELRAENEALKAEAAELRLQVLSDQTQNMELHSRNKFLDQTATCYEELRKIIDGGSESYTHEDAVKHLEWLVKEGYKMNCEIRDLEARNKRLFRENESLGDSLVALEAQEPVATLEVFTDGTSGWPQYDVRVQGDNFKDGKYKLFLAAGAKP